MPGRNSYSPVHKGDKEEDSSSSSTSWRVWLKKELTWNRKLIPIKIIQFLYSGGTNALLPYLTLHMKEIGLSNKQIGIVYAFSPIATIMGPPLSGMLADRTGRYKYVVLLNMLMTIILHIGLLYLPSNVVKGQNPLQFACDSGKGPKELSLVWEGCDVCHDYQGMNFSMSLQNCYFTCEDPPSMPLEFCFEGQNSTDFCRQFNNTNEEVISGTVSTMYSQEPCSYSMAEFYYENNTYQKITCPSTCTVTCDMDEPIPCVEYESYNIVFWTYLFIRLIATFFLSSLFTMMDAMTIAIVNEHGGEYGKQRFLFILGMAIAPPIAGFLNEWDDGSNGTSAYLPAMYFGAVLCIASSILIARLQFKVDMAKDNMFQDLKKLVVRPEIVVYLLLVLILGSNWGFIESYLFVYMEDLGSPYYLMGLTMTVGSLIGMPVMLIADKVVNKLGRHTIFMISFFAYAVRHFGYSIISTPTMVFPFELLEVFTYQLMWVAAITYCPVLAPPGLLATLMGAAGAIHFSVGRGVGSFIGGQLIAGMDIPRAFQCYGGIAIVSGLLYIVLHFCYFKKKIALSEQKREALAAQDTEFAEYKTNPKK